MTKISKIFAYAVQNFVRNAWLSLITLTIIVITLIAVNVVISLNYVKGSTLLSLENFVNVTFSLYKNVTNEEVASFVNELDTYPEVESIEIRTPDENLETFKQNFPELEATVLAALEENPLTYTVTVKAFEVEDYNGIIDAVNGSDFNTIIESTSLEDFRTFIETARNFIDRFNMFTIAFSALFALIGLIVIFNTIRVSIYTHRDEIGIMKLVGATNWFVRAPFVIEGLLYSLASVAVTFLLIYPALKVSAPALTRFFQGIDVNLLNYYQTSFWQLAASQFVGIAIISFIATVFAMRKYLRA